MLRAIRYSQTDEKHTLRGRPSVTGGWSWDASDKYRQTSLTLRGTVPTRTVQDVYIIWSTSIMF